MVAWTQIGAPHYDSSASFVFNTSPHYDSSVYLAFDTSPHYEELFRESGNGDEITYDEIVWFAQEMDRIANDANTSFVPLGRAAWGITGLYAAQVNGKLVATQQSGTGLHRGAISEIRAGARPIEQGNGRLRYCPPIGDAREG